MPITSWRIVKEKYLNTAFSGEGAKKNSGRWNSVGSPMVYTAGSLSLATLEIKVHLPSYKLLKKYKCVPISFKESSVFKLLQPPPGWNSIPPTFFSMTFGDQWIKNGQFSVMEVPSVIIPGESNFLINPNHPDFQRMIIGSPLDFPYDSRVEEH